MMQFSTIVMLSLALSFVGVGCAQEGRVPEPGLFVNLTHDEGHRANMAIFIAHEYLEENGIPATIFLNVDGVRLADKRQPQASQPDGKTHAEKLQAFMRDGGKVYICPMCMRNVAVMSEDDVLDGVQIASVDDLSPHLFGDGVKTLSY